MRFLNLTTITLPSKNFEVKSLRLVPTDEVLKFTKRTAIKVLGIESVVWETQVLKWNSSSIWSGIYSQTSYYKCAESCGLCKQGNNTIHERLD